MYVFDTKLKVSMCSKSPISAVTNNCNLVGAWDRNEQDVSKNAVLKLALCFRSMNKVLDKGLQRRRKKNMVQAV